jgi:hypothetical protein
VPPAPPPAPPTDRIEHLERRVRWLTAVCVFLGMGLVLVYVRPFLAEVPDLRVRSLTVNDSAGVPRVQLGIWRDGSPYLRLNGPEGTERIMGVARPDGRTELYLADRGIAHRNVMALDTLGRPTLRLAGSNGVWRLELRDPDSSGRAIVVRNPARDTVWAQAARSR